MNRPPSPPAPERSSMPIDFLLERFVARGDADAIVWHDQAFSYRWLLDRVGHWRGRIAEMGLPAHANVALVSDFSPNSAALLLALAGHGCVVLPMVPSISESKQGEYLALGECTWRVRVGAGDEAAFEALGGESRHELFRMLKSAGHPGLVLFSSGSTGKSKGVVHDFERLMANYLKPRAALRTVAFLLFDHIGGINTMLHTLASGGCLIVVDDRSPDGVLEAIARHRAELLPTSPTFLNLVLLSGAIRRHDLASLQVIAYATEPMPETTLARLRELLPGVRFHQNYGLSEVGILRSKSESSDSLWVQVGGDGYETRVVDGILQIKAQSAMLGYLNAPCPFTEDGWFVTGDLVERKGDFFRFQGRQSELINVGGEKVYPAEVENVLRTIENVADAVVYGEKNPILGNIVCARVTLVTPEDRAAFTARLKKHCATVLKRHQVPVKVEIAEGPQHTDRFKKARFP